MSLIELHDPATGCRARIAPQRGFNCYSFEADAGGQPHELLWSAPGFERGAERASGSGIPLLFPFAGRIRGTEFRWQNKNYELPPGDPLGNAIHGFVIDRPWNVVEQSSTKAVADFQASRDDASLLPHWPADFRITVSYELLLPATLSSKIIIENPDDKPLPLWFGTHPYFRVPLGAGGSADACRVTVPAAEYWELAEMLPTGKRLPADGQRALQQGLPFSQTKLDDVFAGLTAQQGRVTTRIEDPAAGRALVMEFDDRFTECVVYNPPHREAICIEPYSAVPDAFTLDANKQATGLMVLAPGESWETWIDIRWE